MPVPLIVPDASVILKWVLPSGDGPNSDTVSLLMDSILKEKVRALVPALWLYEVGNTVARRFPEHAAAWMFAVIKFELEESQTSAQWLATTLQLTEQYGVTFYDRLTTPLPSSTKVYLSLPTSAMFFGPIALAQ